MQDIAAGFRVGADLFPWGTLLGDVASALGIELEEPSRHGWRHIETACAQTYGLDTFSVSMTSPGLDRPVTALSYEIAPAGDTDPAAWMAPLMRMLGTPQTVETHDLPACADPSGCVRFYANWPKGDQSAGLSLYGAPRRTSHGLAAGCLWLNWATVPAARPFLSAWRERVEALAEEALSHSGIVTFLLSVEPSPAVAEARQGALACDSAHALGAPQLLPTPAEIARRLGARGIGFWRSGDHRRWHASTCWDTVSFEIGAAVEIDWYDIAPAKGGGFSEIAIDGWSARDLNGSRAIADAVAALKTIPGVTVKRVDGYDC